MKTFQYFKPTKIRALIVNMSKLEDLEKRISQLQIIISGKENQIRYLKDQLDKSENLMSKATQQLRQHEEIIDAVKLALDQAHPAFKNQCDKLKWLDELLNGQFDASSNYYN